MSHYNDFQTEIRNREALIRALCRCINANGQILSKSWIENHKAPISLYGYQGDERAEKASIIIRRGHVGPAANDIGFAETKEGTYQMILSDYDKRFYDESWRAKLYTFYNVECSKMALEAKGRTYKETVDQKGRIQLTSVLTNNAPKSLLQKLER